MPSSARVEARLEVGARGEAAPGAGDQHRAHGRIGGVALDHLLELAAELGGPRVQRVGAVEREPARRRRPAPRSRSRSSCASSRRRRAYPPPHAARRPRVARPLRASGSGCGRSIVYIDPYRVPDGRADGRPDPRHPRALRPLLAAGRRAPLGRAHLAGGAAGGGRARERAGGLDRARRGARRRARARRATWPPWPPTTPRSATPRAASSTRARPAGWATTLNVRGERALPLRRHRRDPRDGQRHRRGRGAAAGERRST